MSLWQNAEWSSCVIYCFFLFAQWNASETNSGWERSPAHFIRTNDYLILLLRVKPLQNVLTLLQKCFVPINENISSSALRVFSQIQSNIRYMICMENCRCPIRGSPCQLTSRSAAGSALKTCLINPPHPGGIVSQETAIWGFPSLPTRRSWLRIGG